MIAIPVFLVSVEMNPRTVCFCQPVSAIISCNGVPPARSSMSCTIAFLLNARGTRGVGAPAAALAALGSLGLLRGLGGHRSAGGGRLGRGRRLQLLDRRPDARGGLRAVLELLHRLEVAERRRAGEAVPGFNRSE